MPLKYRRKDAWQRRLSSDLQWRSKFTRLTNSRTILSSPPGSFHTTRNNVRQMHSGESFYVVVSTIRRRTGPWQAALVGPTPAQFRQFPTSLHRPEAKRVNIDACVIRTHAPEGTALAGLRVNHSAKAPSMMGDAVV